MRALVLLLLLAAGARAQVPDSLATDSTTAAPSRDRSALYLGGLAGGLAGGYLADALARAVSSEAESAALVGYPVGVALGVYAMGQLTHHPGSTGELVRGTVRGTLLGYAAIPLVFLVIGDRFPFGATDVDGLLLLASLGIATVTPVVLAVHGYTATPVRMRTPDGATVSALAVRVAF